jgi:ATP-dependent DNA helicase DinG
VAEARAVVDSFFAQVESGLGADATRRRLVEPLPARDPAQTLERLAAVVDEVVSELDDDLAGAEMAAANRVLHRAAAALSGFELLDTDAQVYWFERAGPGRLSLLSAPLDVAPALRHDVYDRLSSTVLTSATLTTAGRFDFFRERLGLDDFILLRLDSPFDFARCSLLYVPARLPPPTAEARFPEAAAREIGRLIELSRGRALVLFTSYAALNAVFNLMPEGRYRFLRQGDYALPRLLDEFRQDRHSVLFATQSFWQGVDVPGEALSCLVICRLPFEVPDEPRLSAIAEQMREQGLDPFTQYQLPTAVLRFRQGFGRLIRSSQDRGVVCVLDRRVVDRAYGPLFLSSLPAGLPVTENLDDVRSFFKQERAQ